MYHSSVIGGASCVVRSASTRRTSASQRPAGLAPRLTGQEIPVLGEPRHRPGAVAREVACLDGEMGRFVAHRLAREPPVGELHRLAPPALAHRFPGGAIERLMVKPEQAPAGRGDPLLELRRSADRKSFQEPGNVEAGRMDGVALRRCPELQGITGERCGQLHERPLGMELVTEHVPKMLECLPKGGTRLGLGRLAPQEPCQCLSAVLAGLQHQVRQQGERLGPQGGHGRPPLGGGEGGGTEESQREGGHEWSKGKTLLTYRGLTEGQVGNHDLFTAAW